MCPLTFVYVQGLSQSWWPAGPLCHSLFADPLADLGPSSIGALGDDHSSDDQYLVALTDGLGRRHELMIRVNEGDADANTGIFGIVQSKVGGGGGGGFVTPCVLCLDATALTRTLYGSGG